MELSKVEHSLRVPPRDNTISDKACKNEKHNVNEIFIKVSLKTKLDIISLSQGRKEKFWPRGSNSQAHNCLDYFQFFFHRQLNFKIIAKF